MRYAIMTDTPIKFPSEMYDSYLNWWRFGLNNQSPSSDLLQGLRNSKLDFSSEDTDAYKAPQHEATRVDRSSCAENDLSRIDGRRIYRCFDDLKDQLEVWLGCTDGSTGTF
ncbi:hypothetical protein FRC02_007115 [Tulasnella sp. 418]|nr:hypothetical protein FRC02_007115 [Tulasnella sp. 418]